MSIEAQSPSLAAPPAAGYSTELTRKRLARPELELGRCLIGLSLAATLGFALGARRGGADLVRHALGLPLAFGLVAVIAVPALFLVLSLFDGPITFEELAALAARSLASTGLVAAGLAPATLLLLVTVEADTTARFIARASLALPVLLGGAPFFVAVYESLAAAPLVPRLKSGLTLLAFSIFATALAHKLCFALLPVLNGGR